MSLAEISPLSLALRKENVERSRLVEIKLEEGERINLSDFSTVDLIYEFACLKVELEWLRDELRSEEYPGNERGYSWRQEFLLQIAYIVRMMACVEMTLSRRADYHMPHEIARMNSQGALPQHDADHDLKLQEIKLANNREQSQADFFVKATQAMVGPELFEVLWDKARLMFPNDPAWQPVSEALPHPQPVIPVAKAPEPVRAPVPPPVPSPVQVAPVPVQRPVSPLLVASPIVQVMQVSRQPIPKPSVVATSPAKAHPLDAWKQRKPQQISHR